MYIPCTLVTVSQFHNSIKANFNYCEKLLNLFLSSVTFGLQNKLANSLLINIHRSQADKLSYLCKNKYITDKQNITCFQQHMHVLKQHNAGITHYKNITEVT